MLPLFYEGTTEWTVYPFISSGKWEEKRLSGCRVVSEMNMNHPHIKYPKNVQKYMGDTCFGYVIKSEKGDKELWKIMSDEEKEAHCLIVDQWVAVSKHIGNVKVIEVKLEFEKIDTYSVLVLPSHSIFVEMDPRDRDWFHWKQMVQEFLLTLQYIASKGIILSENALCDCVCSNYKLSLATLHGCQIGCEKLAYVRAGMIARDLFIFILSGYFESLPLGRELLEKIGLDIGENDPIDIVIKKLKDNTYPNFGYDEFTDTDTDTE